LKAKEIISERITSEILLTDPNALEVEHLFSFSPTHHIFNLTIFCIKYKVDYENGEISNIEYHQAYKNCFSPISRHDTISGTTFNTATTIIKYYLEENPWLKGWELCWTKEYHMLWKDKMTFDAVESHYNFINEEDSTSLFLLQPLLRIAK
jgi:hypothetical protein